MRWFRQANRLARRGGGGKYSRRKGCETDSRISGARVARAPAGGFSRAYGTIGARDVLIPAFHAGLRSWRAYGTQGDKH